MNIRTIIVKQYGPKYVTIFLLNGIEQWSVESYIIEPHEVMVDWIEKGILPKYTYR